MARLGGIVFDIAPQADDEIVYGARVRVFVQAPDFFQNRFAGHDAAVVADEMAEKLGFHKSQVDGVAVDPQLKFAEVDGAAVEGENVISLGRRGLCGGGWTRGLRLPHPVAAAQQSLQTGEQNGKFKRFGKIVVSAGGKAVKHVLGAASRGEHQHRSEEHTSELQSRLHLVCRLLLEKKKTDTSHATARHNP